MEFLLPYPSMRPSPVKPKHTSNLNKLSLKSGQRKTKSCKENRNQALYPRIKPNPRAPPAALQQKDLLSGLISSDESDQENHRPFSDSTLFDSQLYVPKAESTRLDINKGRCSDETNQGTFFSCKSQLTQSSSDSGEQGGACEESIIYLSDDESFSLPKQKGDRNIVIPESTESDSDGKIELKKEDNKTIEKTILLESSDDESAVLIKKHIAGKKVLSRLNSLSKNLQDDKKTIVIPESSYGSDSTGEVVDSSIPKHISNKQKDEKWAGQTVEKKKLKKQINRKVIPETSEEEDDLEEDQEKISPRTLAAEKLSATKVNDIHRWLDQHNASLESKEGKSNSTTLKSPPAKEDKQGSSTDDSFDGLLRRYRKQPAKTPAKSSFIVDDSSDSSASYSNYRKVLARDIKRDVKDIEKTPLSVLTRKVTTQNRRPHKLLADLSSDFSESEPDGDGSSSSEWDPDFGSNKKTAGKTVKKTVKPKPVKPKPSTVRPEARTPDFDTPRPDKKPTDVGHRTPFVKPETSSVKKNKVQELKKSGTPYSPIRTFLTSLSGPSKDPSLRSHPEASIYFKNFKSKKEELAKRLFKLYNREVFESRLPEDMVLEWNARMISTAGYCSCKMIRSAAGVSRTARIVLSSKVLDSAERLRDTLIHELCHAAVWLLNNISGGHGPFWKAWAMKAAKRFPELPPINRCHEYTIETKYTYRCTDCGYSFGRHSKSINLQTQRCGHCYGIFEVLVNKQGRNAGSVATPSTPKPVTGFALFVKENYGSVKKDHSDKKHGDIMKILGQKFAEVKIK